MITRSGEMIRRPGPFGPARALLPSGQEVLLVNEKSKAWDALEQMVDSGYSQLPVCDESDRVVGVFSYRSFSKRALDLKGNKLDPAELCVRDCMEEAIFISPDTYIDTDRATDWGAIDYVLVGAPEKVIGVLCVADVFGRLNDFAEAFVLLYEIELDLRDVIKRMLNGDQLQALFEEFTQPKSCPVQSLEDMTFSQYHEIICSRDRWEIFEPLFQTRRELALKDLMDINELRNVVFHFRRQITTRDTDRLRRFHEKLRFDRQQYESR